MNQSIIGSWVAPLLIAAVVMCAGCKGDPAPAESKGTTEVDQAKESGTSEAPETPQAAAEASDKGKTPAKVEAAPAAGAQVATEKAPTDKATLAKAYVEIYCAQRKKETERLLEIYTRYGFADPKGWTASWTEAAKDDAWVAEITQKAIQTCP